MNIPNKFNQFQKSIKNMNKYNNINRLQIKKSQGILKSLFEETKKISDFLILHDYITISLCRKS